MTVPLTVRHVRDALYSHEGGEAEEDTRPSTLLLGQLFHKIVSDLLGADDERLTWRAALAEAELGKDQWKASLIEHTYRRLVGPMLSREQSRLHDVADRVLSFWQAVQEMCGWLAGVLWAARGRNILRGDLTWAGGIGEPFFNSELSLEWEVREGGWTDAVRLTGLADLVLRIPGEGRWCVVELKLGRGSPAADLMQACLYHLMLTAQNRLGTPAMGTLAMVSFRPACEERLISPDQVAGVRTELMNLIGRLAGVLPEGQVVSEPVQTPPRAVPTAAASSVTIMPVRPAPSPSAEHLELGRRLVAAFREYGVIIETDGPPIVGPTFLRFPIQVGTGVRFRRVSDLAPEVRMRLGLAVPPFVDQPEGRVVIDIHRRDRQTVLFAEIRNQLPQMDPSAGCSKVLLGVGLNGRLRFADLSKPEDCHILVAGTTGSGKTEWLRSAIAGLLLTNTPETLRLVLIDPKRNAFSDLKGSRFLYDADGLVYPDEQSAVGVLKRLADEMDGRYAMLEKARADHLTEYQRKTAAPMPRIVCVCDEYADLVSGHRADRAAIEAQINRLGSKARAAGIHLILATQQPSRQVVTGALVSNIPARVGLKTTDSIESRMLLGSCGAENLLGLGDLLFKDVGDPIRLQAPYLTPEMRKEIFATTGGASP